MNHRPRVKLLALLGFVLVSMPAVASDQKIYPGVQCRNYGGGAYAASWGTVANTDAGSELAVICPIVRDADYITSAYVQVWDRHPDIPVSCDLRYEFVASNNSIQNVHSTNRQSEGYGSNAQHLNYPQIVGGHYYYLFCTIPRTSNGALSHIIHFGVTEP